MGIGGRGARSEGSPTMRCTSSAHSKADGPGGLRSGVDGARRSQPRQIEHSAAVVISRPLSPVFVALAREGPHPDTRPSSCGVGGKSQRPRTCTTWSIACDPARALAFNTSRCMCRTRSASSACTPCTTPRLKVERSSSRRNRNRPKSDGRCRPIADTLNL